MVTHTYSKSMDQPGKVASPARGQLNENHEPEDNEMIQHYDSINSIQQQSAWCSQNKASLKKRLGVDPSRSMAGCRGVK